MKPTPRFPRLPSHCPPDIHGTECGMRTTSSRQRHRTCLLGPLRRHVYERTVITKTLGTGLRICVGSSASAASLCISPGSWLLGLYASRYSSSYARPSRCHPVSATMLPCLAVSLQTQTTLTALPPVRLPCSRIRIFRELEGRIEQLIDADLRPGELKRLASWESAPQAYQNIMTVLAAETFRREGDTDSAIEAMSSCTNPAYQQLWAQWLERTFGRNDAVKSSSSVGVGLRSK